jgi:hypothetical protein
MATSTGVLNRQAVVLWQRGPVSCTCQHLALDHIEISLCVNAHPLDRKRFTDTESAAQYAIAKMRSYNA